MAEVRSPCAHLVGDIHIQLHACLMSDSRKVKHAVGGTAESHIYGQGVHEGLAGHNVSRADILLGEAP